MPDLKTLPTHILIHIATSLTVPMKGMLAVIELLDGGATVPFIARYRKEVTGNLDELQIRNIEEKLLYFRELEDRRETILASIQEQGKLTNELKARIEAALDKSLLEDLISPLQAQAPHQGHHRSREGGSLEPLATISVGATARPRALGRVRRWFHQRRARRGHGGGSAGRRPAHCRGNHPQRSCRHSQAAPQGDV